MSLSVNLILNNEQRSGSKLNIRTLSRIAAIAGPALLLALILQQGLNAFILHTNLSISESRWAAMEPRQIYANRQLARLNQNLRMQTEIEAWELARIPVDQLLVAIMESTPPALHVSALRHTASPVVANAPPSPPKRLTVITLEGRVSEPGAMVEVQSFQAALQQHALMADFIEAATVINFAAAPGAADTDQRIFTIRCRFKPLP